MDDEGFIIEGLKTGWIGWFSGIVCGLLAITLKENNWYVVGLAIMISMFIVYLYINIIFKKKGKARK